MKAVILGNTKLNYSWFVLTHRQGLKLNGAELFEIDYKSNPLLNIKQILLSIKADYVFTHLTFHAHINSIENVLQMQKEVNKKVGTKFIHTCNDARKEDRYMSDISDAFYMAFVGTHDMKKNCEKVWKIPVFYSPYSSLCYDKILPAEQDLAFREAVFTGSPGSHKDRSNFIQKLSKKIPLKIFQTQSNNDLRHKTRQLSSSAKCILGLCTGYDIDGYIDVRPFQYLGAGACMIIRKFKNMDKVIPSDIYFPINSYDDESIEKTVYYYKKCLTEDTSKMREKAFKYIQENHSCKVRIREVLDKIR
jgi:hypothetical protein